MVDFWQATYDILARYEKAILMYVLRSEGSSPGRQGFHMTIAPDLEMCGSIGGGIMEHKLVELSRSLLSAEDSGFKPFIKHQVHRDGERDKSGMICSGEQTIAFFHLEKKDILWLGELLNHFSNNTSVVLSLNGNGVSLLTDNNTLTHPQFESYEDHSWTYRERLGFKEIVYIIGAGHVGLALSRLMRDLDFYVIIIDDRKGLNTLESNQYAHKKIVQNYDEIASVVAEGKNTYVIVASFGYRTDKVILRHLSGRNYNYLGMMGSKEKVKRLFEELQAEGHGAEVLEKIHSPIGVAINSKTPMEIAVSVAAEIIQVKNR